MVHPTSAHSMEALARRAVDEAMAGGADAADARIVRLAEERLVVQNGALKESDAPEDFGIALRV